MLALPRRGFVPLQTQNARAQNQVSEGHSFVILNLF
jgi:hypothetical protein